MRKEVIRETDFSVTELPRTRWAQFKDLLKHQFLNLVKISCLQTVFNMPLLVWAILFVILLTTVNPEGTYVVILVGSGILIPCVAISNIGLSGMFYCLKRMAYSDGLFAASSYFVGMKEEWKKGLVLGLLQGLAAGVALAGTTFLYFYTAVNPWVIGLGITLLVILYFVMTMVNYYSLAQTAVYSNKTGVIIKNSFLMSLMRFPKHLLLFLLHPGLAITGYVGMCFIPSVGVILSYVWLALFVILNSIGLLAWMLFILTSFDKFINKENYPDYVGKGLYKESKED